MKKRPLLICTDPGIDDFIALCYLLQRPEFDIVGMPSFFLVRGTGCPPPGTPPPLWSAKRRERSLVCTAKPAAR